MFRKYLQILVVFYESKSSVWFFFCNCWFLNIHKTVYLKAFSALDVNIHCCRFEVARCVFVRTILQIGFQRPSCLSCRKGWKNSELIFFFFLNIRFWIFYSTIFLSKSSKYFQERKFKNSFPTESFHSYFVCHSLHNP